jgi:FixJ family two-component response regulator
VTVKVHRKNVMEKMGAEIFAELIHMTEQLH